MTNEEIYRPPLKFAITTYELDEESGVWIETLAHVFYGNTIDEIQGLMAIHRKADKFFDSSFLGSYDGIILKNEIVGLI